MIRRRDFLAVSAALLFLPQALQGNYARPLTIRNEGFQTIALVQQDLFPGENTVPSAARLNALNYLGGVLDDPYVEETDKAFINNGATWLNEAAQTQFGKTYYHLNQSQRQDLLSHVTDTIWGDNWLWTIMAYLFEAMLGDPVYGANTGQAGWSWLKLEPGYPRPQQPYTELGIWP